MNKCEVVTVMTLKLTVRCFFITSTVVDFINLFDHKQACEVFVESLRFYQASGDFTLLAWVLMPNHFHLIIKLGKKKNISVVIGNLKRYTARQIGQLSGVTEMRKTLNEIKYAALNEPGKGTAIWKLRFDSFVITSGQTLRQKIEYIHNNPIRKCLVEETWQWYYSSAAMYVRKDSITLQVDSNWSCLGY